MTFLLPTKGRIKNLRRFLTAAREMGSSLPCWILVNEDELERDREAYEQAMKLAPMGYELRPVKASCYGDALRAVWGDIKNMDWVGLVSDDLVPCSSLWDTQLVSSLQGWNFVSSNDGWQANQNINVGRMHGATVWSGPLLRAVGYLMPAGLRHIFHDDAFENLGRETGAWSVRMDIMVKHLHEALEGVRGPTMDPTSDLWKHDEGHYKIWRLTEFAPAVERIKKMMAASGVTVMKPDFSGVSLMIGTPSLDGKYEGAFMASLFQTFQLLQANQVSCQFAEEKYTADITRARANIFSTFLRSDATHLLTIDADMGWSTDAIVRLFCAKKDFVAVAGPKKRYPLQFAANFTTPDGDPVPLQMDNSTGTMEVGEVGSAFTLITRACAQKIADAHPELQSTSITGEKEWHVYDPIVTPQRKFGEDFAFCKRWRDLGGKVHICPDVPLKHIGSHTFEGSFASTWPKQ